MSTKGQDPANPFQLREGHKAISYRGLTKREYFAAKAAEGISVNYSGFENPKVRNPEETVARRAVEIADALIEQLNQ